MTYGDADSYRTGSDSRRVHQRKRGGEAERAGLESLYWRKLVVSSNLTASSK